MSVSPAPSKDCFGVAGVTPGYAAERVIAVLHGFTLRTSRFDQLIASVEAVLPSAGTGGALGQIAARVVAKRAVARFANLVGRVEPHGSSAVADHVIGCIE